MGSVRTRIDMAFLAQNLGVIKPVSAVNPLVVNIEVPGRCASGHFSLLSLGYFWDRYRDYPFVE